MKHHPKIRRPLENRILSLKNARDQIHDFQMTGHCVGLCHGCFDVLHFGHLRHFEAAAEVCDMLVVSVTADRFVNKGENRPVFHDRERAELLSGIYCVDFSVISEYPSAHNVLEYLKPTMFFKGSEYLYGPESVNPNFLEEKNSLKVWE